MEALLKTLAVLVACLLVLIQSAPLKKDVLKPTVESASIEDALKALSKPKVIVKGVTLSKSKTETETNINGHKTAHSESETKIGKPSGHVVADVLTKSDGEQDGDEAPQVVSQVLVPDQAGAASQAQGGLSQAQGGLSQAQGGLSQAQGLNPLDYSPRAVAEYLLATGDYSGVMQAFQRLVETGQVTSEAATMDVETVMSEYADLMQELQAAEQVDEPVYYDEDPAQEQLEEQYLNQQLQELQEPLLQEQLLDDYNQQLAVEEEMEKALQEEKLRQQLASLIDRIYDDLEAGRQNEPVDTLTENAEQSREPAEIADEPQTESAEAREETEALESLSAARKESQEKKKAEKKDDKKSDTKSEKSAA